jgi:hypothetical protein
MIENAVPPLAAALAAAASSRLHLEERESNAREAFLPSVSQMDEADRRYRQGIEESLPHEAAATLLSSMLSFREQVREIRERTRREIGELFRRYGMNYGAFDPLDPYVPPTSGFSHMDSTRVATISDRARAAVDDLRARVNENAARHLSQDQMRQLKDAKLARRNAFEVSIEAVLEKIAGDGTRVSKLERDKVLYALTQLADGWY